MNFDKDKKTSPFSLNTGSNVKSPFSLQNSKEPQDKKSPFTLSSIGKPNLSTLNSNNNSNGNSNSSPFTLTSTNVIGNNNSSPFSLQSSNSKPLLNQLNNNTEKPNLFSLQSTNVSKPVLSNSNNTNITSSSSPFTLTSNNNANSASSPFSLTTSTDKKLISPFSAFNTNTNTPFTLQQNNNSNNNNSNSNNSPFTLKQDNTTDKSPFTLKQNNTTNNSPFSLQQNPNTSPFSLSKSSTVAVTNTTITPNNSLSLSQTREKPNSPFTLQTNSKPLSSMISDTKPTLFTLQQSSTDTVSPVKSIINSKTSLPSSKGNLDIMNKKMTTNSFSPQTPSDNDLTKKNALNTTFSIFASFNVPSNDKKVDKKKEKQNNSLIAKPSGFAKFLLDMDEEEDHHSNNLPFSLRNNKKEKRDGGRISPLSPNILLDLDEESANQEAIEKLKEIHKLFRNTSPYYLMNFIDWEETEGYDEEEDYIKEEEIENESQFQIEEKEKSEDKEGEEEGEEKGEGEKNQSPTSKKSNNNNKTNTTNTKENKIHKLFKFDTPSPDDIVIMSREKGKKDVRDTNYRSTTYLEKKNEDQVQQQRKANSSNVEVSSDHVIRIGSTPAVSGGPSKTSSGTLTLTLSDEGQGQRKGEEEASEVKEPRHPDGFNFKYSRAVLEKAFPPEEEIFDTEEEKAESDYYKYQTFEDEYAKVIRTYYPPLPETLPAQYNSVYYHKIDLVKELEKRQASNYKKSLHITCLGPLKSGKSTLLGRIYEEYILKPANALREVKKVEKELQRRNQSLEKRYAWLMDETKIEKERNTTLGITTDYSVTYHGREFVFYDTPGHTDYISTTLSELYQTDVILLMIDASSENINNECDIAIIKDYLFLCKCIGIQDILVVINKMEKIKYSKMIYQKLLGKIQKIVEQYKFKPDRVKFIPTDGLNGENIFETDSSSTSMDWYTGESIFYYLDKIESSRGGSSEGEEKEDPQNKPFRMVVKEYSRENGIGGASVTVEGSICSGVVQVGENLLTTPNYDTPFVRAIECQGQLVKWAVAGDDVRIGLGNIDISKISKDTILCSVKEPLQLVNRFKAQILVNSSSTPIIKGTNAILYINNHQESVYIKKIKMKKVKKSATTTNSSKNKYSYKRTTIIPKNTVAEVLLELHDGRRVPLVPYGTERHFGRFILQHDSEIIASGVVLELL